MTIRYTSIAESRAAKQIDSQIWITRSEHALNTHCKPKKGAKKRVVQHHLIREYANKKRKPKTWTVKEIFYKRNDFEWVDKEYKADADCVCYHLKFDNEHLSREEMKFISEEIFKIPFEKTDPTNF